MSRNQSNQLIVESIRSYDESLQYAAPEVYLYFLSKGHRHPGLLVQKMLTYVPQDAEYDEMYNVIATTLHRACCPGSLFKLHEEFWTPMSDIILPQYLGNAEAEWQQQIAEYWCGLKDYEANTEMMG